MTEEELNAIGIKQWDQIRDGYNKPDLLLGNGFSISLSENFKYDSLFDAFIKKTDEPFKRLFRHFETTNFEQILNYLNHTENINTISLFLPLSMNPKIK